MSKAVLISIRPKWCELIASGRETIEVRKNAPKIKTPFKCYIYCTKYYPSDPNSMINTKGRSSFIKLADQAVIGEFVCDSIYPLSFYASDASFFDTEPPLPVPGTCLTDREIVDYLGNGKTGYGWQISDLVIYGKPKKLSDFYRWYDGTTDIRPCENGKPCEHEIYDYGEDCTACAIDFDGTNCPFLRVTKPPQSWCYVEELE